MTVLVDSQVSDRCPWASCLVCDFPYDFSDIVDGYGLRRMCLQYIRMSYDVLLLYYTLCLSCICPDRQTSFLVCDFPYDFSDIVDDHGLRRMCLQYIRTSYNVLLYVLFSFIEVFGWLVDWGLTSSHHLLRSYGDGTSVYSPIRRTGEIEVLLYICICVLKTISERFAK